MRFDWKEYLRLAKEFIEKTGEAELRSAVSRAYYAVFIEARNLLTTRGFEMTRSSVDHKLVSETLKSRHNTKANKIGVNLDRLRKDRNKADYDNHFPNLEKQAKLDVSLAEKTYELISELKKEQF